MRQLLVPLLVLCAACSSSTSGTDGGRGGGGGTGGGSGNGSGGSGGGADTSDGGPPLGTNEPRYDAGRDALILTDGFDQYADFAAAQRAYPIGRSQEFCELTTGRGGTGKALRLNYGTPNGAEDILFGPEGRLDAVGKWNGTLPERAGSYNHFLVTYWFRLSPGADPAQVNDWGVKGFMHHVRGASPQGGRYEAAVNRGYQSGGTRFMKLINPDNATLGLNVWKTPDGMAPLLSQYADGQWHRATFEFRTHPTDPRQAGGRAWLDGAYIYDDMGIDVYSTLPEAHQGYLYAFEITDFAVWGNFVDTPALSSHFTVDFDDWIAWTN